MKKQGKNFTAWLLAVVMTLGTPGVAYASDLDLFTDGSEAAADRLSTIQDDSTDNIPAISTLILEDGKVGTEYYKQMEALECSGTILWSLGEGSTLPKGMTFSPEGVLSGTPQEDGDFQLFVIAQCQTAFSEENLDLHIQKEDVVIPEYGLSSSENFVFDLGNIPDGSTKGKLFSIKNAGNQSLHFKELPQCQAFTLTWFDHPAHSIAPNEEISLSIDVKEGLPSGSYEEKAILSTEEGLETEITLKIDIGAQTEQPYSLKIHPDTLHFSEKDFQTQTDPEKGFCVNNIGAKETKIKLDTSELKHFKLKTSDFSSEEVFAPGQGYWFSVVPLESYGTFQESIHFITDDGSRFSLMLTMKRVPPKELAKLLLDDPDGIIQFGRRMEGYKVVPEKTVRIKNISDETIRISLNRFPKLKVGRLSLDTLKPGETAEVKLQPLSGLKQGSHASRLSFLVKGQTSGFAKSYSCSTDFYVTEYQYLPAPEINFMDTSGGNLLKIKFRTLLSEIEDADGFQVVSVKTKADLDQGNFRSSWEGKEQTAVLKYLAKGAHSIYFRTFSDTEQGRVYGAWSEKHPISISVTTPKAPKLKSVSVRFNDIKLNFSSPENVHGYDVVIARKKNGTEPLDYIGVKKGVSGKATQLVLGSLPKGTYYVGIHSYRKTSGNKKILSRWSELKKITVKTPRTKVPPLAKNVKVSKRTVSLYGSFPKPNHTCEWVLTKTKSKDSKNPQYLKPGKAVYTVRTKKAGTLAFKNVKPGTYYLFGRGYLKAYRNYYTKWSEPIRIKVK